MICKITQKKISPFMSFGKMPIANGFLKKKFFKKEFDQSPGKLFDLVIIFIEKILQTITA